MGNGKSKLQLNYVALCNMCNIMMFVYIKTWKIKCKTNEKISVKTPYKMAIQHYIYSIMNSEETFKQPMRYFLFRLKHVAENNLLLILDSLNSI